MARVQQVAVPWEQAVRPRRPVWRRAVLALWPLALAFVLLAPLYGAAGSLLARDLVFLPRHAWNDAALGLSDGPPRAVPLDSVMALLTSVVDGQVLARVVLPLLLASAGWGVAVLVRELGFVAQLTGSGFAVWNLYVVERLALGQWALLAAYAALPWALAAGVRFRRSGRACDIASVTAWSALASLTPTGGLVALATTVAATASRRPATMLPVLPVALLQLPWVVASLTGTGRATSSADGVTAFAPDTDSPVGSVVALLGLGGIWDSQSEPATAASWFALVVAVATVATTVVGIRRLRAGGWHDVVRRLVGLAAVGLAVAVVAALPPGRDLLEWTVESVPGAGLLRDAQKLLAPYAVLASVAVAAAAGGVARMACRWDAEVRFAALVPLVVAPVLLVPDAPTVTWPTVTPVELPSSLAAVEDRVADDGRAVATLPWRSYRGFTWADHGRTSSDPLVRMLTGPVVVSDDLQVGSRLVPGEGALTAEVSRAVEARDLAALERLGVGWLVVYGDDPQSPEVAAWLDSAAVREVARSPEVTVHELAGTGEWPESSSGRRTAVVLAHLAAALVALVALVGATCTRVCDMRRKGRRSGAPDVSSA